MATSMTSTHEYFYGRCKLRLLQTHHPWRPWGAIAFRPLQLPFWGGRVREGRWSDPPWMPAQVQNRRKAPSVSASLARSTRYIPVLSEMLSRMSISDIAGLFLSGTHLSGLWGQEHGNPLLHWWEWRIGVWRPRRRPEADLAGHGENEYGEVRIVENWSALQSVKECKNWPHNVYVVMCLIRKAKNQGHQRQMTFPIAGGIDWSNLQAAVTMGKNWRRKL